MLKRVSIVFFLLAILTTALFAANPTISIHLPCADWTWYCAAYDTNDVYLGEGVWACEITCDGQFYTRYCNQKCDWEIGQ